MSESPISNARDAIGDSDGGKGGATIESRICNASYAVRNNRILTTSNKCISGRFYDGIAIFTTVIGGITAFNYHGGEGGATIESTTSNTRYAVRDGNGGEGGAIRESIISNARYAVGGTIVGNGFRNRDGARVFIGVRVIIISLIRHFYLIRFVCKNVVVDAIDFKVMRPEACCGEKCHKEKE